MRDELLATEARVHAHEQHKVKLTDDILEKVYGSRRVKSDTCHHTGILDLCNGTVQVGTCLVMDVHYTGIQVLHRRKIVHWLHHHEVNVERFLAQLGNILEHRRAERKIRNEHAVHNIDV